MSYLLEASLEAISSDNIYNHFKEWYPKEGCGFLVAFKGRRYWIPCDNLSDSDDNFIIDTKVFLDISRRYDIIAIVHSHVESSPEPSEQDVATCNALNIPFYIYSFPSMECYELLPQRLDRPLFGRDYKFGEFDCFEAVRDYYRVKLGINVKPRVTFEDDWWHKGLDYFTKETIAEWGFKPAVDLKKGDLITFTVNSPVPNHCGVYLGEDVFFHHAVNRISCRENLYPLWKRYLTGIYRYEA